MRLLESYRSFKTISSKSYICSTGRMKFKAGLEEGSVQGSDSDPAS
jgi:hypothetical protein